MVLGKTEGHMIEFTEILCGEEQYLVEKNAISRFAKQNKICSGLESIITCPVQKPFMLLISIPHLNCFEGGINRQNNPYRTAANTLKV